MPETLARLFRHTIAYGRTDMMLTKQDGEYRPIAACEVERQVGRLRSELFRAGLSKGDRCALLSENRWEWAVSDFAMMTSGIVNVPLYPTLTAEQIHYMLEHSGARVIMVSTTEQLEKIRTIWERLPLLEGVIIFDKCTSDDERIVEFTSLIREEPLSSDEKKSLESSINEIQGEDLASIIYTSGTTGTPKGVMLTHANFASNIRDNGYEFTANDVALSFLPLCHVAERMADYAYYWHGTTVAYAESLDAVAQNILEVRPTIALAVPRFFEKIHSRVMEKMGTASPIRRNLFNWAVQTGIEAIPYRLIDDPLPLALKLRYAMADKLVLSKLRDRLGGRMRYFVSGAAPLGLHLAEFFYAVGIPICEAYGLTETSPVVTANHLGKMRLGTVGKVIPNVEVKIAHDGEILVRGPNVMRGYYKMDTATNEAIIDGWFYTGDIGEIDQEGYLKITDRKKDLLKTSGGKYIAPQPIENLLKSCDYVSTAVVIAERRNFPSALIVPNFEKLRQWAKANNISAESDSELAKDSELSAMLESEVQKTCATLASYEQVKKIAILEREFSIDRGEITPTMKVRRHAVEKLYASVIDEIYTQ